MTPLAWLATCDYEDAASGGMRITGRWLFWTKGDAMAFMRKHQHRNVRYTPLSTDVTGELTAWRRSKRLRHPRAT